MPKFKWNRSLISKLSNAIKKFNNKIYDSSVYIEPKSYAEIKGVIRNKRDFDREINKLNRVHKPGALDVVETSAGYKMTRYERNELNYDVRRINTLRAKYRKKYNISEGKIIFNEEYNMFSPKHNFTSTIANRREYEKWKQTVVLQSQPSYYEDLFEVYKNNLLNAIENNWPDNIHREKLIELLKRQKAESLWMAGLDDVITNITYIYESTKSDVPIETHMERALQEWSKNYGIELIPMEAEIENDEGI